MRRTTKPHFWKEGDQWGCARPGPPPLNLKYFEGEWWKRTGLRGFGSTKEEALTDLKAWENAAAIVSDIY